MRKLIGWIWGFVPEPAKAWVVAIAIAAAIGAAGFVVYKIDANGYDRCEADHTAAENQAKDSSRADIVPSGKKYEAVKSDIIHVQGANAIAGPRVSLAIASMPGPNSGRN